MLSYYKRRVIRFPLYGLMIVSAALLSVLAFRYFWFSVICCALMIVLFGLIFYLERQMHQDVENYISTLSYRLKHVGEEALMELPIGILLFNDDLYIEWTNHYFASWFEEETIIGRSLYDIAEPVVPIVKQEVSEEIVSLGERQFTVILKPKDRLLYFFDITEQQQIVKKYEEEKTVLAIIYLDNYDDITQGMDDPTRSKLNSLVTSSLNKWAKEYGIFMKRINSDRFITVFNDKILKTLAKDKFSILDEVREMTGKQNVPLTLSIGVGEGDLPLPDLGDIAQSSLDLALGRGGDQVAIKQTNGKVKFYGGKTNPMEKRTRVRARVISHALKELILESDKVIVMGHKYPDMDAIGAAMGIRKVAEMNKREGFIVLNFNEIDNSVKRLLSETKKEDDLYRRIITPEEALDLASDNTLLVVVDTHKSSLVIDEKLLNKMEKVVVIDHHRRGENFIKNPLLVYMEPYASSTCELVTELLEYQPKNEKLSMLEATALLSGIIVDTKSFTLRTGSRTFDAASYLRAQGADTVLVQKFLKENIETFIKRSKIIETVYFYGEGIAIATGSDDVIHDQVLIAQAADTILTMDRVSASFVIGKRDENTIGISARSLGDVNVQVIMEDLGGGGHLTNAATQISDVSIEEAEKMLKEVIDTIIQGGQSS
ncbi:c-di-AMP phosphodiesterase-like protein [Oikeobacillus pervagus]|uniref:Cyclic-di-AMP phosphodiesterase n=1 Tax=Oikeobacillus pervagus TaxID=1325931 RepID=A0AAJ1SYZ3_9BACI|nr:DHH family phosphoesterase [Oikeobacillus pervagus]MDQ0215395.1 c-di-AMP phosphodiesterase-like protein [Oikeobacillus pervagus]